ncbi:CopD family protein [Mesobacillus maritimus]|uniref:copper resistance D family protein n=1 Tax=Mesobacillus maritimus TaxID=1643336 RepID=UPI00203CBDBF|nr:CopD family protein [Mesobacillus maritimus]MCM3670277.1 CopD family protein [Mesobacillus maritimus]
MIAVGTISQALLYFFFATLIGSFILSVVPNTHRPGISEPKSALMIACGGIAIFSFFPVWQLVLYLAPDIGLAQTMQSVLFTFEVGKAWIFTYFLANVLFIYVIWFDYRNKPLYAYVGLALTFIMILAIGWSSHASSYDRVWGFFSHTMHFTAVSVWVGILFVVSWFSKDHINWSNFLKWFTPVAIICLVMTIISGFILMTWVVEFKEYTNSWMLPYGQILLIKHLLIIPLLVYAMINGLFIKKKLKKDAQFNPRPWAKVESSIILLIFSATAAMGQQSPPHETNVSYGEVSKLFTFIYQGQFQPGMNVELGFSPTGFTLIVLAVLFIGLVIFSFIKKAPAIMSFFLSVFTVLCVYLSIILSIN